MQRAFLLAMTVSEEVDYTTPSIETSPAKRVKLFTEPTQQDTPIVFESESPATSIDHDILRHPTGNNNNHSFARLGVISIVHNR